jgi:hypothetical protein
MNTSASPSPPMPGAAPAPLRVVDDDPPNKRLL